MSWQYLELTLDASELAEAESLLRRAGAEAISLADGGDTSLFEPPPGEAPLWPRVIVRGLFPETADLESIATALRASLSNALVIGAAPLPEEEWLHARPGPPTRFGRRLVLAAADAQITDPGSIVVRLNMGLAFGTGEHPTTAMCLEWMDVNVPRGARVLDYGCGSGVLAIAALMLGADHAWAVDLDPQALRAARASAELNGVEGRLWVGAPWDLHVEPVDILMANILAAPLQGLAEDLAQRVRPGGWIVVSGFFESQTQAVRSAYEPHFGSFTARARDGWACLSGRRT